jgi:hypothetical protein
MCDTLLLVPIDLLNDLDKDLWCIRRIGKRFPVRSTDYDGTAAVEMN